jgi:predicted pyridoxine 5'-phosphate oxidase superfamily flavin-nucleotide-binding protein
VTSPYHPGEIAVQERAGVRAAATKIGTGVRRVIEPPAAHFLAHRYTLYVGSTDARGRPWASQLVGPPGFVSVPTPDAVRIEAVPTPDDPLAANLEASPLVGLLAIDPATRRRYRVNGIAMRRDGGIEVAVVQAYGNCPKYIQRREPVAVVEPSAAVPVTRGTRLTPAWRERLERADTFFLATAHPTAGTDVSHRGGRPGFVRVLDERTLAWPDYQGNMMFMSLGNIAVHPVAGILLVDFESGDVLQLTGEARIDWDPEPVVTLPGAARVVELRVDEIVDAPGASPLRCRLVEASPFNP